MKYICPLITVKDMNISKYFYQNILNQKIKEDYDQNVVFEGDFSIHLQSHYAMLIERHEIKSGGNNFELYFEENDLESLQLKLKQHKVDFLHEIKVQPWQQKVLRIFDPDKNIIEVGESLQNVCLRLKNEGKSIEEIMEMTSLSMNYVKNALENDI